MDQALEHPFLRPIREPAKELKQPAPINFKEVNRTNIRQRILEEVALFNRPVRQVTRRPRRSDSESKLAPPSGTPPHGGRSSAPQTRSEEQPIKRTRSSSHADSKWDTGSSDSSENDEYNLDSDLRHSPKFVAREKNPSADPKKMYREASKQEVQGAPECDVRIKGRKEVRSADKESKMDTVKTQGDMWPGMGGAGGSGFLAPEAAAEWGVPPEQGGFGN